MSDAERIDKQHSTLVEVEVIDPYVMDLVRKHGSTMTNSEIVQKFLPKQKLSSQIEHSGDSESTFTARELAQEVLRRFDQDIPNTIVQALRVILVRFIETGEYVDELGILIGKQPVPPLGVQRWEIYARELQEKLDAVASATEPKVPQRLKQELLIVLWNLDMLRNADREHKLGAELYLSREGRNAIEELAKIFSEQAMQPEEKEPVCPACKGSGENTVYDTTRGPDCEEATIACVECGGTGAVASPQR